MHTNWIVLPTSPAPPVFNGAIQALLVMGRENSETYGTGGRRVQQQLGIKTDENGRKNLISTFVSIFFGGKGSGFRKCGFENGIGICGHTETDKYG
jgi:hypothetical protein